MASSEGRDRRRAADAFFSAASHAAKGTAALTSTALAQTIHATEVAAKGTVALGESTLHATGSSVSAIATTTRNYTGKFQSSVKQSMLGRTGASDAGHGPGDGAALDGQPPPPQQQQQAQQPAAPKPRSAAERRQDVRADHVIFDTATEEGRGALLREAASAINANTKLREKLRHSDGTREQELQRLLRQYQAHIGRCEGNILSTVQGGAKGQERLDLARHAAGDMTGRLRHFSDSAARLADAVEQLRRLTRPLEVAEAHSVASMGKLEHLAGLVEHVRRLRDLAPQLETPAARALYFETAADLIEQSDAGWGRLTSSSADSLARLTTQQPPSAKLGASATPAEATAAALRYASHPRLAKVIRV
jgi:hypothetical protein